MSNKPTHGDRAGKAPAPGPKDSPPTWYAGTRYVRIKPGSKTGGKNNSGPSGKRHTRYYPPVKGPVVTLTAEQRIKRKEHGQVTPDGYQKK